MPSITVLDSAGATQTVQTLPTVGSALSAASLPVVIASDQALWPATQPVSGTVTISGTVPVSGTFWQATQPVSIASMPSTPVTGTFWQATQPVSLATNAPTLQAGSAVIGKVGIDQTTPGTTNAVSVSNASLAVTGTFWQATQPVSLATNTPTIAAGTALIGKVGIDQTTPGTTNAVSVTNASFPVTQATASSLNATVTSVTPTPFSLSSAASTNANTVKASAGTLYTLAASNVGASAAFLKLYNLAANPTVGTSVPALTIPIPASGVVSLTLGETGHRFATGIALAITNLVADSDTTAVAAAQVKVLMDYI